MRLEVIMEDFSKFEIMGMVDIGYVFNLDSVGCSRCWLGLLRGVLVLSLFTWV